ncbi:hypothetical protein M2323_001430 [Rhodoblastus acidophilus]|nr:hypothetical protein [Rhodoblastus acidophilus]MCW2332518.1 hypothetical protein [Rhodoblastus acidophilus]
MAKFQAAPFPSWNKPIGALPRELKDQSVFRVVAPIANHMRTNLATKPLVRKDKLFFLRNRFEE